MPKLRRVVVSYKQKYVHKVLVICLFRERSDSVVECLTRDRGAAG